MMSARLLALVAALGACGTAGRAPAGFITVLPGPSAISGSGIGAVNTILTLQSPANSTTATGGVAFDLATQADVITGDAKTGANQTKTITETALAGLFAGFDFAANNLLLVLNLNEPGNVARPAVVVVSLVATFYDVGGFQIGTATLAPVPVEVNQTGAGIGQSGQGFLIEGINPNAFRIGLAASINQATGGPETFFVGDGGLISDRPPVSAVPVPAGLLLVASGLPVVGFGLRRRLGAAV